MKIEEKGELRVFDGEPTIRASIASSLEEPLLSVPDRFNPARPHPQTEARFTRSQTQAECQTRHRDISKNGTTEKFTKIGKDPGLTKIGDPECPNEGERTDPITDDKNEVLEYWKFDPTVEREEQTWHERFGHPVSIASPGS